MWAVATALNKSILGSWQVSLVPHLLFFLGLSICLLILYPRACTRILSLSPESELFSTEQHSGMLLMVTFITPSPMEQCVCRWVGWHWWLSVLVHLGLIEKIYHILYGLNNKHFFLTVLERLSPR